MPATPWLPDTMDARTGTGLLVTLEVQDAKCIQLQQRSDNVHGYATFQLLMMQVNALQN